MARILADENFPLLVVEALRRLGHDVVTFADINKAHQAMPDQSVLHAAAADGRAVATLNRRHFIRLHAENPSHAGIIVCTFDLDFEGQAQRIDDALRGPDVLAGGLFRVQRRRGPSDPLR